MKIARCQYALLAFSTAMLLTIAARSATLYEQPTLNPDNTDLGAFAYFGQELADNFSLASSVTLGSINWKGGYYGTVNGSGSESFTVHLYSDNSGIPNNTLFYSFVGSASVTPTADARGGHEIFNYALDVADIALTSGTFWISIYTNDSAANYAWSPSTEGNTRGAFRNSAGPWFEINNEPRSNFVFVLNSSESMSVIEPSSLSIVALSALGLGLIRRRNR